MAELGEQTIIHPEGFMITPESKALIELYFLVIFTSKAHPLTAKYNYRILKQQETLTDSLVELLPFICPGNYLSVFFGWALSTSV